ncbi:MAG: hypothetical protein FJ146_08065 [Deltaproteobacteria bacterium]|nr:hypothetical protein [Deltaproteobacteria bacterium]
MERLEARNFGNAGNVGIGTTSPSAKLHVAGTAGTDGIMFPDGTLQKTAAIGSGSSQWTTSGSNIYFNAGGVGIGKTSPIVALDVAGSINMSTGNALRGNANWLIGNDANGTIWAGSTAVANDIRFDSSAGNIATFKSNGNIGIGTTSPAVALEAYGTTGYPATSGTAQTGIARFSGSNNNVLDVGQANGGPWGVWLQGTDRSNLATKYPIILQPNGGNVGIGTTVPSDLLHIKDGNLRLDYYATGTMPRSAGTINFYDRGFPLAVIQAVEEGPNYGYQSGLSFYTNPGSGDGSTMAERVRISKSGNVGIGTTAPATLFEVGGVAMSRGSTVKSADGNTCYQVMVDNSGSLNSVKVNCSTLAKLELINVSGAWTMPDGTY